MRKWFIVKDQSVKGKLLGCPLVDNEAAALMRVFEVCFTLCAIENMTINLAGIYPWLCRWRCVFSVILGSQRALEQRALWGQRLKSHNFSLTSTNSVSLCRGNYPLIHFSASKKITFFILGFWLSQAHTHTHTHTRSSSSARAEEDFDGVVVDRVGQLQQLLLPRRRHHLQHLSGGDKSHFIRSLCTNSSPSWPPLLIPVSHMMWQGSFRSFRQCPASHFFFVGNVVLMCLEPAWVFFTPHHGASEEETDHNMTTTPTTYI